ncbi:acyl carrier protein [Streptomyces cinnamoneus]|uniref:acyl carrier protein n=1 Tax=Streptomyces sp. NPDC053079 TaxID=3365697 RepID=UPI0009042E54
MTDVTTTAIDIDELRATIAAIIEVDVAELTDDARFDADLEVDSLLGLEIQVSLEEKYGVELPEEEFKSVKTLSMVHELLTAKKAAG